MGFGQNLRPNPKTKTIFYRMVTLKGGEENKGAGNSQGGKRNGLA